MVGLRQHAASGARQLLVDGVERRARRLDLRRDAARSCPNVGSRRSARGTSRTVAHELKLVATDSAGNATTVTRKSVNVDGNGPTAVRLAGEREDDHGLGERRRVGVAGGTISVRNTPAEPFRALPTTLANGRLTAKLDRGSAARVGIAVNVTRQRRATSPRAS